MHRLIHCKLRRQNSDMLNKLSIIQKVSSILNSQIEKK